MSDDRGQPRAGLPTRGAWALLPLALAACSTTGPAAQPVPLPSGSPSEGSPSKGSSPAGSALTPTVVAGAAPRLTSAELRDGVRDTPDGPEWTTTWRACFTARLPSGGRLEAQALTTEGSGRETRPLSDGCLSLVVARGEGRRPQRALRDEQLFSAGALAYRVRAAAPDGRVSPWSEPVRVTSRSV